MRISDWGSDVCSSDLGAVPSVRTLLAGGSLSDGVERLRSHPRRCPLPEMRRSASGRGPAGEWQSSRGSLRMKTPISAADQRGFDWFTRWAVLGCSLQVDDTGNLKLIPPPKIGRAQV